MKGALSPLMLLFLAAVGLVVLGVVKVPGLGAAGAGTAVTSGSAGCYADAGNCDVAVLISRSIPDNNGARVNVDSDTSTADNGVQIVLADSSGNPSTAAFATLSVESGTTTTSATQRLTKGQKFWLTFRNDTYYNQTFGPFNAGQASSYELKAELIPSMTGTGYNDSSNGFAITAFTSANTTITGTAGSYDFRIQLSQDTDGAVLRANPMIVCIRTNSTAIANDQTRPLEGTPTTVPQQCYVGGSATTARAWTVNVGSMNDISKKMVSFRAQEDAGENAAANDVLEIRFVDGPAGYIRNAMTESRYVGGDETSDIGDNTLTVYHGFAG